MAQHYFVCVYKGQFTGVNLTPDMRYNILVFLDCN